MMKNTTVITVEDRIKYLTEIHRLLSTRELENIELAWQICKSMPVLLTPQVKNILTSYTEWCFKNAIELLKDKEEIFIAGDQELGQIPDDIELLGNLKTLSINNGSLCGVSKNIAKLNQLTTLEIVDCWIADVDISVICDIKTLSD